MGQVKRIVKIKRKRRSFSVIANISFFIGLSLIIFYYVEEFYSVLGISDSDIPLEQSPEVQLFNISEHLPITLIALSLMTFGLMLKFRKKIKELIKRILKKFNRRKHGIFE